MNPFKSRREALIKRLPNNTLAIIPGAREKLRNGDSHYAFRQASSFYYLTGFNEPDAVLLISTEGTPKTILFNRPNNPQLERWTGPRLGQVDAIDQLQVDEAFPIETLRAHLPEYLANKEVIYFPMGQDMGYESSIRSAWREVKKKLTRTQRAPDTFKDIKPLMGELRVIKDKTEIESLKKAQSISIDAHRRVMEKASVAKHEYELEAEFIYALGLNGCKEVAYTPIVAGGERACVLHYTDNNQPLKSGDLLLIDAGAEVDGYAADITRTYPLNGKFGTEQRAIYELVLEAQRAGISCVKPGTPWDMIQTNIVEVLTEGLKEIGILKDGIDLSSFYMHSSGHWMGLDVHDEGEYKLEGKPRALEPNMVLTVEPGLYIDKNCTDVDEKWRGIGVRIEDDILVTETGHDNLTGALPVNPDELEQIVSG